jgi:aryl-alcohol dehydrogenase-like predicted oxidoreductase
MLLFDTSENRDYTTSIEELAHSLDALVKRGKVLYLGVSDTPAWVVAQFNQYAKDHVFPVLSTLTAGSPSIFRLSGPLECL